MAVTVNVRWHEDTALFTIVGEVEIAAFELMRDALAVARTDAGTIVIDVSEARLSDRSLLALRHALDGAKVARPVLVCGPDGDRGLVERVLGGRAVVVGSLDTDLPARYGSDGVDPEAPDDVSV